MLQSISKIAVNNKIKKILLMVFYESFDSCVSVLFLGEFEKVMNRTR